MTRPDPSRDARSEPTAGRIAIIDIGSNSIRLVVYDGVSRVPAILFNEKVMAGLGRSLAATGAIDGEALDRAVTALARFGRLAREMGVTETITVATAAVRDAANGAEFLDRLAAIGLPVRLLSGDEEAAMAAGGVLAGIPQARGIVGDLGGGSLELVEIGPDGMGARASFPFGVLRLAALRQQGPRAVSRGVSPAWVAGGWGGRGRGLPFYMVGGSWRALAHVDMERTGWPLPIAHHYRLSLDAVRILAQTVPAMDRATLKAIRPVSGSRLPSLGDAATLLDLLCGVLDPSKAIVSAYGLREGLLRAALPDDLRDADPLIEATREEGRRQGRFPEHGDLLYRWIAPVFADEDAGDARLCHAACLLGDVGWRAHPEFRAERGLETALHGNWVGVDARGRAMMGQALFTSFGGTGGADIVARLCSPADRETATRWGLAMRLGQRLSGGVSAPLTASALSLDARAITLTLAAGDAPLYGESVERRHRALAAALGRRAVLA